MTTFDLATIAPRLALAHRQRRAELLVERSRRRRARSDLLKAEWAVAHCDLQLARAGATGRRSYIEKRHRKLEDAQRRLAIAQARAQELGAG